MEPLLLCVVCMAPGTPVDLVLQPSVSTANIAAAVVSVGKEVKRGTLIFYFPPVMMICSQCANLFGEIWPERPQKHYYLLQGSDFSITQRLVFSAPESSICIKHIQNVPGHQRIQL